MLLSLLAIFVSVAHASLIPGSPGPYQVANAVYQLTDESRWDIFAPPGITHKRRIVVSTFLPVDAESCSPETIPYMPPRTVAAYGAYVNEYGLPADLFEGYEFEFCQLPETQDPKTTCRRPLVIFSPGLTTSRLLYSAQARALSSYGYVVITVDHPYDATFVEFPDGTGVNATIPSPAGEELAAKAVEVRVEDVSFLMDVLQGDSAAESLSEAFVNSVNLEKTAIYGHSLGGATAGQAAFSDDRFLGGMDFDGTLYGQVIEDGLDKPLILTGRTYDGDGQTWEDIYNTKLRGPKMLMTITGATHYSFIDARLLLDSTGIPEDMLPLIEQLTGTIDGFRLQDIVQGVLKGFLDLTLQEEPDTLLGVSEEFTEIDVRHEDLTV